MIRAIAALVSALCVSYAQTKLIGEVTAKSSAQITVKADSGEAVEVPVTAETKLLRIPPGETSLSKALAATIDEINSGDRVLVRPNQIIIMSRSDLQQKQAADQAEWQKRGVSGKITSLGPNSFVLSTSSGSALNITTTPKTQFRRYALNSIRFDEAKPAAFPDLKIGDQARVLGDKSDNSVAAEIVVSGSFRNFAATVLSVDEALSQIKLTDLETKKPVTVKINRDSNIRRMPPMMAQQMAQTRPQNQQERQRPRNLEQMLNRMPALSLSELKPGDAVIVASSVGADAASVAAIALIAGVEPLLTGPPTDRRLNANWSLEANLEP